MAGRNLLLVLSGWSQCNYGFEVRQVMKASSVQEGVNNGTWQELVVHINSSYYTDMMYKEVIQEKGKCFYYTHGDYWYITCHSKQSTKETWGKN